MSACVCTYLTLAVKLECCLALIIFVVITSLPILSSNSYVLWHMFIMYQFLYGFCSVQCNFCRQCIGTSCFIDIQFFNMHGNTAVYMITVQTCALVFLELVKQKFMANCTLLKYISKSQVILCVVPSPGPGNQCTPIRALSFSDGATWKPIWRRGRGNTLVLKGTIVSTLIDCSLYDYCKL